jgi:hypothetical protein
MGETKYYFFVEGDSDGTFFEKVIFSISGIPNRGNFKFIKYARSKKEAINGIIKTLRENNFNYFFFTDFDKGPCVTSVKEKQKVTFPSLEDEKIFVVIKKIESWYLAGLDNENSIEMGIENFESTDNIAKGKFEEMKPAKYNSVKDFSLEILKRFSVETAKEKNGSFKYSWIKIINKILE